MLPSPKSGAPVPTSFGLGRGHSISSVLENPIARLASQAGFADVGGMVAIWLDKANEVVFQEIESSGKTG